MAINLHLKIVQNQYEGNFFESKFLCGKQSANFVHQKKHHPEFGLITISLFLPFICLILFLQFYRSLVLFSQYFKVYCNSGFLFAFDLYFLFLNAVITHYWHVFCPCPLVSLCCTPLSNSSVLFYVCNLVYLLMSSSETLINNLIIIKNTYH